MLATKFQVLFSTTFLALTTPPMTALTVRHAAAAGQGAPRVLSAAKALRIERGLVPKDEVQTLYQEILEAAVPGPHDGFHGSLLGIMGDAGAKVEMIPEERVTKFRQIAYSEHQEEDIQERESGILRIEHLKDDSRDKVRHLVDEAVENSVLENEGTVHIYLSRPNSAALANHTDPTDIFVLQLDGTKEWTLCQDVETFNDKNNLRNKLDKCSTYDPLEMSNLVCQRETLYPGDALYLPKRVVHSARATNEGVSAHLTFGFADNMCSADSEEGNDFGVTPREGWSFRRFLEGTCNSAQGGSDCDLDCNSNCNSSCDGSCNGFCDCSCDSSYGYTSCDSCCDAICNSECDSGCYSFCDSGCDTCPNTGPSPSPPTSSTSELSTILGMSDGAIAGVIVAVCFAIGICLFLCKKLKLLCYKGTPEEETVHSSMMHGEDTDIIVEAQRGPESVPGQKKIVTEIVKNRDGSKTITTVTTSFAAKGDKMVTKAIEEIAAA